MKVFIFVIIVNVCCGQQHRPSHLAQLSRSIKTSSLSQHSLLSVNMGTEIVKYDTGITT